MMMEGGLVFLVAVVPGRFPMYTSYIAPDGGHDGRRGTCWQGWVAHGECGKIMVDMIKNIVCMGGTVKESFFVKLKKTLGSHDLAC